jgi:RNA polymerase sigma factor (sigma-70 family)
MMFNIFGGQEPFWRNIAWSVLICLEEYKMDRRYPRVDYQRITDLIRPSFRRLTQNADQADEAIQEAWARWIAQGYALDDETVIKKQLTVFGRNFFFNCRRRRQTERRNQMPLARNQRPRWNTDEEAVELKDALESLTSLERLVLDKRFEHNCSFSEIADCLGVSESSVRRLFKQALARLKRFMKA